MTDNRFATWLEAAKARAAQMEQLAPLARHTDLQPLALPPAAPTWLEPRSDVPAEQPCGFVRSMIARSHEPGLHKFRRAFHGQDSKRKVA